MALVALAALGVGFALGAWWPRAAPQVSNVSHGSLIKSLGPVQAPEECPDWWGSTPTEIPDDVDQWSLEELRTQYRVALVRVQRLQQGVTIARAACAQPSGSGPGQAQPTAAKPDPPRNVLKETFYPTTPESLAQLARECSVRVDEPPVLDSTPGELGNLADELHASPDEARVMGEVVTELHKSLRGELRVLYEEVVGRAPSQELSSRALLSEIYDKTPAADRRGVLERIARERAGELPPRDLAEANAYERAQRLATGLGDSYQELLARKLGAVRTSALRAEQGGWPWSRSVFTGCDGR